MSFLTSFPLLVMRVWSLSKPGRYDTGRIPYASRLTSNLQHFFSKLIERNRFTFPGLKSTDGRACLRIRDVERKRYPFIAYDASIKDIDRLRRGYTDL